MTALLRRIYTLIDRVNGFLGRAFAWCLTLSIVVSVANALSRKFLYWSSNSLLELQWYLFGATFMMCAAWTLREDKHVRIDIVLNQFGPKGRRIIELAGLLFIVLPFSAVLFYLCVPYLVDSVRTGEVSNSVGGLILWPAKALLVAGFFTLVFQSVSEVLKILIGDRTFMRDADDGLHKHAEKEPT